MREKEQYRYAVYTDGKKGWSEVAQGRFHEVQDPPLSMTIPVRRPSHAGNISMS